MKPFGTPQNAARDEDGSFRIAERCLKCPYAVGAWRIIMSEEFGSDFVTIIDDDGQEFELEVLDTMDYNGGTFTAFLPADMEEDDPDYGIIILRSVMDEKGEEVFESIDDDAELDDVYQHFMAILFDDDEEEEE